MVPFGRAGGAMSRQERCVVFGGRMGPLVIPSPRRGGMTRYANEVLAGVVNQNARPRRVAGVMTCTTNPSQEVRIGALMRRPESGGGNGRARL